MKKLIDSDVISTSSRVWEDEDGYSYTADIIEVGGGSWANPEFYSWGPIVKMNDDKDSGDRDIFMPTIIYPEGTLSDSVNIYFADGDDPNNTNSGIYIYMSPYQIRISSEGGDHQGLFSPDPASVTVKKSQSGSVYNLTLSCDDSMSSNVVLNITATKSNATTYSASTILDMRYLGSSALDSIIQIPCGTTSDDIANCRITVSGIQNNRHTATVKVDLSDATFDSGYSLSFTAEII